MANDSEDAVGATLPADGPPVPSAKSDEVAIGARIGNRYRVTALLGQGGMGAVYLALDEVLDKARLTGNPDEQKPLYLAFQKYLSEDDPGFVAYAVNFICAYRKDVDGVQTHPMRWFDLRAARIVR